MTIQQMKDEGFRVFTRKDSITGKDAEYCYVTDGTHIAYVQWSNLRTCVSTVHIPNHQTGTGFIFADEITPYAITEAMHAIAPAWALGRDRQSVRKYKDWDEFHQANSFNQTLVQV